MSFPEPPKYPPRGGKIVYTTRQSVAMTVNTDRVILVVPKGKRWLLHWGWMQNKSGATIDIGCYLCDSNGVSVSTIVEPTRNDGQWVQIPHREGRETKARLGHGAFPVLLEASMRILLVWGVGVGKSGTSYWFLMIEEFTP